jgi:hypothetical protein
MYIEQSNKLGHQFWNVQGNGKENCQTTQTRDNTLAEQIVNRCIAEERLRAIGKKATGAENEIEELIMDQEQSQASQERIERKIQKTKT